MGAVTSLTFAYRNSGKAIKGGEGMRGGVAGAQVMNACDMLRGMEGAGRAQKYAQKAFENVDKIAKEALGISNAATKLASFTSKAVNPLLCGAAGIRILKDKNNREKAFTEELCSMSAMFGAERIAKMARQKADAAITSGSLEGIVQNEAFKKIGNQGIEKIKGMTKGQKTALFIAAELLFVGISITAFDQGKKFGKFLTGRNEEPKSEPKKEPVKEQEPIDYES